MCAYTYSEETRQPFEHAGFRLAEAEVTGPHTTAEHSHERPALTLILQGACYETYRGRTRLFEALDVNFNLVDEPHRLQISEEGVKSFGIAFDPVWLEERGAYREFEEAPVDLPPEPLRWLTTRLHGEFEAPDDLSPLVMEGLVLEIVGAVGRTSRQPPSTHAPAWLDQVTERVREEFAASIGLSSIAEAVGIHPTHLARVFRKHHGCTLGTFIRRVRVSYACRRIAQSDVPLATVALESGFSDQSHFSRSFKRVTGTTPSHFRSLARRH